MPSAFAAYYHLRSLGISLVYHSILREKANSLDFDSQRYRDIFNERTQGADTPVDIDKAFNSNAIYLSATAITHGTCLDIAEPTVPTGARFWWIDAPWVS